jgi:hypothetical protein
VWGVDYQNAQNGELEPDFVNHRLDARRESSEIPRGTLHRKFITDYSTYRRIWQTLISQQVKLLSTLLVAYGKHMDMYVYAGLRFVP